MFRTLGLLFLAAAARITALAAPDPPCSVRHAAAAEHSVWLLCDQERLLVSPDSGATWQMRPLPAGARLRAIAFLDARRGFVAGDGGTLLATVDGGGNWSRVKLPTEEHLMALYFVGEQGWLTGWGGVILHTGDGGRTWNRQPSGVTQALESVFFLDASRGWAVGWVGTILRTVNGGKTWELVRTPSMLWSMNAVYFADARNGWIVGFGGEILRSRDGGATWKEVECPVKTWLTSLQFDRSGRGWITADRELLASQDGGESWQPVEVDPGLFLRRMLRVGDSLWAIGQFGVLRQTGSEGKWQPIDTFPRPASTEAPSSGPPSDPARN